MNDRFGDRAEEIVNLAAEAHADLIVVGTHGRSGMERWVIGSVAERVVRQRRAHPSGVLGSQSSTTARSLLGTRRSGAGCSQKMLVPLLRM